MVPDPAEILRDPARLAALADTRLADTSPEEAFDRLTRLAARLLAAPMSALTLMDGDRQFLKGCFGLPDALAGMRETPAAESICRYVVAAGEPLVIGDAARDGRVRDLAIVAKHGVRAYAGVPVATHEGHVLGTLCVCDARPREWGDDAAAALADLAALAGEEIQRRADGTRRERAALLREAESWFRSLVEQSIAGIYAYQGDRFVYVNPRFAQIFGRALAEFAEPGILERIVHPEDLPRVRENVRRRFDGEVPTLRYALRGVRPDGDVLHLEVHGTVAELGGAPVLIGVGIDVTERVRAEQEREAAIAARDRFYALVSHELRTPISTIMLYNDLLLSELYEPLSDPQREAVDRAQDSARHLLELINDLLDLSRLEAGEMEVRDEPVEVGALLRRLRADALPLAREHGCELQVELPAEPVAVVGDERRIRQVVLNLLSNAVKFGPGRPIRLRAARVGGGLAIEVADQGPGIEPADIPRIFEDFVQLGAHGNGTGLGLPISRRLAELMGGRLDVVSTPGEGSTFRLLLPRAAAPAGG